MSSTNGGSPGDIWAVGYYYDIPAARYQNLIEHWDGASWQMSSSPNASIGDNFLNGVYADSADDAWAVGYDLTGTRGESLAVHWDGQQWSLSTPASPSAYHNTLEAVVGDLGDPESIWAVGYQLDCFGCPTLTLIEHYTNWCPSPTPTATVTPTQTPTSTHLTYTPTPIFTSTTPPPTYTPTTVSTYAATPTPCLISFADVHPSDYFYDAVRYLYCEGAITGYADGTFRPYNNTTRGQLCKIVVLAEGWPIDTSGGPHFSDVNPGSAFYRFIETAYNRSIVSGYLDGTFRWANNVTRGQLCKIIVLTEGWQIDISGGPHFTDVSLSDAFYPYIETAFHRSVVSGYSDGTFRPGNDATRGQIAKIVYSCTGHASKKTK